MCLATSKIRNLDRWNWDGDIIVFDTKVPSARPVVGYNTRKTEYPIDVREFLVTDKNAVMRSTLQEDIQDYIRAVQGDAALFAARTERAFDHRAGIIAGFVSERIGYRRRSGRDPWQFPDETLFIKTGDCEDRAFLMASLLLASGISNFNVRVALGKVRHWRKGKCYREYDHSWVMYKSEMGRWLLLEPLETTGAKIAVKQSRRASLRADEEVEYVPQFLLNDQHLWRISGPDTPQEFGHVAAREWSKMNPKFAGQVHQTILQEALAEESAPQWVINGINRFFHRILFVSPIVDDVDNPLRRDYNPLEHFDNGYIRESWALLRQGLAAFNQDNHDLWSFARAAHAIADFYAHSSYAHFAKLTGDPANQTDARVLQFDPAALDDPATLSALLQDPIDYSAGQTFDLTDASKYSVNKAIWNQPRAQAPGAWVGKLISGRYAQTGDARGFIETLVGIPPDLENAGDFALRGSLPHHDEIAVDDEARSSAHHLYPDSTFDGQTRVSYANQFWWRRNAAREHIRTEFRNNWRP